MLLRAVARLAGVRNYMGDNPWKSRPYSVLSVKTYKILQSPCRHTMGKVRNGTGPALFRGGSFQEASWAVTLKYRITAQKGMVAVRVTARKTRKAYWRTANSTFGTNDIDNIKKQIEKLEKTKFE